MEFVFAFMGVALWALIPGSIAHRKGRSFAAYYFLSFVISPLITLIVVLCVENRNDFGFDMSYTADERATALSEVPQNVIDSCKELRGNQKALKKYLNQRVKFSSITPAQASVLYTEYKLVHPIDLQALNAPTIPLNLPDIPVTNQPESSPTPQPPVRFCRKCGARLGNESRRFCVQCGSPISNAEPFSDSSAAFPNTAQ